jgi:hypothetical protein
MRMLAACVGFSAVVASTAGANPMDLTLSRLHIEYDNPATPGRDFRADQSAFRALSSEYGLAIAPPPIVPAETVGYAGFYFAFEASLTTINSSNDQTNVWQRGTEDQSPDAVLFVPSIHVRKGLPFSFELGTSVSYVAATEQVLIGADVRWALLEGYREGWKGYFPDIAVRGAVNRLMGEDEMDMTVIGLDVLLSYPFAVSGMMTITPFLGYQWVHIIADNSLVVSEADDLTCTGTWSEYQNNCVGGVGGPPGLRYLDFDREHIDRHRGVVGVRFLYEVFNVIVQGAFTEGQQQFGVAIGLDY